MDKFLYRIIFSHERTYVCTGIVILYLFVVSACATHKPLPHKKLPPMYPPGQKPYELNGVWYYPIPSALGYVEEGIASWYGKDFHTRPTSSGEPYNMYALTAAHKILPLGTHVKVTHLENNKSVVVRINDRGPFVPGRIIDLSYNAAQRLDIIQPGTACVKIEAIQLAKIQNTNGNTSWRPEPVPNFRFGKFTIQIGAFQTLNNAFGLKKAMSQEYGTILIEPFLNRDRGYYRVQVGTFRDLIKALGQVEHLKQQGFEDAFVVAMEDE